MKKTRYLVGSLFLSLILACVISCSSNDKKDEGASPDVAEATSDAGADGAAPDGEAPPADGAQANNPDGAPADGAQASTDPNANPDAAALDAPPTTDNAQGSPESKESDMASADQPPVDPNSPPPGADNAAPPPAADDAAKMADANPPPPTDTAAPPPADASSSPSTDAFGAAAPADTGDAPPKKKSAKLAHIKDVPFTKGGQNLNTVYIARDGDTVDGISQKLFGEDRTKQLKKANPNVKSSVKTGDKVYFNSPNRPDDKEKMMTVYEDQGLPPSVYTTKDGDTLKSLAQEWYGTEASYKEIYAINKNVESTKDLPAGTELQYWPASASVAVYGAKKEAEVAQAAPPPPPQQPPPPQGMPPTDPNNPNNMANNPPGGMPPGAVGSVGGPPGGAAGQMAPPAPPPDMNAGMPPKLHKTKDLAGNGGAMDKDTVFYAGLAGILLVSSGLWFALRRRRSRNSGVTQI